MPNVSRRDVLASLGILGSSALLAGCGRSRASSQDATTTSVGQSRRTAGEDTAASPVDAAVRPSAVASRDWSYRPLDPAAVGQLAYDIYPQGSCMYSVFGSVVMQLADGVGEPFRSFPIDMMRFGAAGIGGWGSVCGVVNGCSALIGLFHSGEGAREKREELIANICLWYESEALPSFQPEKPALDFEVAATISNSVLCHVSSGTWCKAAGCDPFGIERRERCRRLSAQGAMKVVQVLNDDANGQPEFVDFSPQIHSCIECHGKDNLRDSIGTMNCTSCHQFDSKHP